MAKCFVIQPFDNATYDKRYEDVFKPAIEAADLEPYRVDKDPGVNIPIDDIVKGIRESAMCFAEISTDNPNVWFELGVAIVLNRPTVMVSSNERKGDYPFDIRHRKVDGYSTESISDFDAIRKQITTRLRAQSAKTNIINAIEGSDDEFSDQTLSASQLAVLASIIGNITVPEEPVVAHTAKLQFEMDGFSSHNFSIGLNSLVGLGFITVESVRDDRDEIYYQLIVTSAGWDWIANNEGSFSLRDPKPTVTHRTIDEDQIPF